MDWWNSFVAWLSSGAVVGVFNAAVFPTLAVLIAGIVAALIGRGSTKRVVSLYERDQRMAAVIGILSSGRRAARWNLLSPADQQHADTLALEAEVMLRLLPATGASMAADWAVHELADMKRDAISFSFQAEQSLIEFRNRMLEWHEKPGRAKRLFKNDLDSWAYEATLNEEALVAQQQAWAAEQVANNAAESAPVTDAAAETPAFAEPVAVEPVAGPASTAPASTAPTSTAPISTAPQAEPIGFSTDEAQTAMFPEQLPVPAASVRQRLEPSADSPA
ncbi:MAG: hypothetical protein KF680_04845 [Cryobacterium sp.]|nr:hypothetical protein [Cryobacterium sp.]